jgi:fimbrial chaperone protein
MLHPLLRGAAAAALVAAAACAHGGTFGVAPLKLELGGKVRTAVITVTNEGTEPLQIEVTPVAWTTAEDGSEQYSPTEDLAVYPPGLNVPPGQKRVVRVGIDGDGGPQEKTYRVFLKEVQGANAAKPRGAQVSMLVNFGVPVFVSSHPTHAELQATTTASKGELRLQVHNAGDGRTRIDGITLGGVARTYTNPYVLAGATRVLRFALGKEECARGRSQELQLKLQDDSIVKLNADLSEACR